VLETQLPPQAVVERIVGQAKPTTAVAKKPAPPAQAKTPVAKVPAAKVPAAKAPAAKTATAKPPPAKHTGPVAKGPLIGPKPPNPKKALPPLYTSTRTTT